MRPTFLNCQGVQNEKLINRNLHDMLSKRRRDARTQAVVGEGVEGAAILDGALPLHRNPSTYIIFIALLCNAEKPPPRDSVVPYP